MLYLSCLRGKTSKRLTAKEYKDATVTRVDPDGVVVKTKSGITKVYFIELPKEVQELFSYDSEKATSYSAEQATNYTAYQKQQDETQRQQQAAEAKSKSALTEQQAATNRTQAFANPPSASFRNREMTCFAKIGQCEATRAGSIPAG